MNEFWNDFFTVHDDVIEWKHFPRNWPFMRGTHRSRWIPHTKASDAGFDVFFDLRPNKRLIKQSWGWWFETRSLSLWRHCNELPPKITIPTRCCRCNSCPIDQMFCKLKSLRPSDAYVREWDKPSLVQIMACRLNQCRFVVNLLLKWRPFCLGFRNPKQHMLSFYDWHLKKTRYTLKLCQWFPPESYLHTQVKIAIYSYPMNSFRGWNRSLCSR